MSADDRTIVVVREWITKAENDLKNAAHTLKLAAECPTDTVCYHAQQCVEKYFKALLVFLGKEIPFTHNIGRLEDLLPSQIRPSLSPEQKELLTKYAMVSRYPGEAEPIELTEARRAVAIARRVRRELRRRLPLAALRRRKRKP